MRALIHVSGSRTRAAIVAVTLEETRPLPGQWRTRLNMGGAWHILRRWPVFPAIVMATLIIFAVFAPLIAPHDPKQGGLQASSRPPMWLEGGSGTYPLGTDVQGRDLFSRVVYGARVSALIAGTVIAAGGIGGTVIGLLAGFRGGLVDELAMRAVDFVLAMPFLLVALVVVIAIGQSLTLIIILLILFSWDSFARVVRAETLQLKSAGYVDLARIAGASPMRIMFRHILPGLLGSVLVVASLRVGGLILTEATLSFLGVGVPPSVPAWGVMVADGRNYLATAWWISLVPGMAILTVVMGVNFLGDWLRDWFDPRLRQLDRAT